MKSKTCASCVFSDKCDCAGVCRYYYGVGEEAEDAVIDKMIIDGFKTFYNEFKQYALKEQEDSYYI